MVGDVRNAQLAGSGSVPGLWSRCQPGLCHLEAQLGLRTSSPKGLLYGCGMEALCLHSGSPRTRVVCRSVDLLHSLQGAWGRNHSAFADLTLDTSFKNDAGPQRTRLVLGEDYVLTAVMN